MQTQQDFESLSEFLNLSSNKECIKEDPFTFLRSACRIFDDEKETFSKETFDTTKQCLCSLIDFCNPKELVIALTEELSRECEFLSLKKIECLLPTLNKNLEAINQHTFVNLLFNSLCSFLEKFLETNSHLHVDEKAIKKVENQLGHVLDLIVDSLTSVVNKNADKVEKNSSDFKNKIENLSIILLRLMSHPFSYLPSILVNDDDYNESTQLKCLKLFSQFQKDLIKFQRKVIHSNQQRRAKYTRFLQLQRSKKSNRLQNCELGGGESVQNISDDDDDDDDDDDNIPDPPFSWDMETGLITLSHFVFNDHQFIDLFVPKVYSHQYLFQNYLEIILSASTNKSFSVEKSISLISSLLKRLGSNQLSSTFLDTEHFKPVLEIILAEVITPSSQNSGRKALDCLRILIWAFSPRARVDFFSYLLFKNDHPGLLGFLITSIKSQMDESLNNKDGVFNDEIISTFSKYIFTLDLPREINECKMKKKVNIHENIDRYMASLNFLRFLVIRSSKTNQDGNSINLNLPALLPSIEEKFLDPLKQELSKNRSSILDEMAVLKAELDSPTTDEGTKTQVSVAGEAFGVLKPDEELRMGQMMLVKLELIESILNRVEILISYQKDPSSKPLNDL